MDPIRKIPKRVTKKFVKKVINRQYFHRKTGLQSLDKTVGSCGSWWLPN